MKVILGNFLEDLLVKLGNYLRPACEKWSFSPKHTKGWIIDMQEFSFLDTRVTEKNHDT